MTTTFRACIEFMDSILYTINCFRKHSFLLFMPFIDSEIPQQVKSLSVKDPNLLNDHCYQFQKVTNLIKNKAGFILHARVCTCISAHMPTVGAAVYTSVTSCAQRICAHMPTLAVKVQTRWTFKASADQRRHSSHSRKRSKVTEGWLVVLHRDVCRCIPMHRLACLYFYPRCNLRYVVAQGWTSVPAAGP